MYFECDTRFGDRTDLRPVYHIEHQCLNAVEKTYLYLHEFCKILDSEVISAFCCCVHNSYNFKIKI